MKCKIIKKVATLHFYITSFFMFIPPSSKRIWYPSPTSDSIFGTLPLKKKGRGFNYAVGRRESDEEWFWRFELFLKLKTTFCTYWLSIKIKFSMTFKYQEYLIKMKMVRQLWTQFKIKFLLNYNMELLCCEWDKNFGGESLLT